MKSATHSPPAGGQAAKQKSRATRSPSRRDDEAAIRESTVEIPVQINGKLRAKIQVPAEADQPALESAARTNERVVELLAGKRVVKTIVVPGRMVNFMVR